MTADREARARKFARLWATGLSVRQVAKRYGVHHQTVLDDLRWLDSWPYDNLKRYRQRRVPARDKRTARAAELRAEGLSLRQIADRLSCSHQTISNDLARWDAEHPPTAANVIPLLRKASRNGG